MEFFSGLYSETYWTSLAFTKEVDGVDLFKIKSVKTLIIEKDQWYMYVMSIFKASRNTIFVSKVKNPKDQFSHNEAQINSNYQTVFLSLQHVS